jgi:hypothetical protein
VPAHVSRYGDESGLSYRMDRGETHYCRVKNVTGGNGSTIGINIEIGTGYGFDRLPLLIEDGSPSAPPTKPSAHEGPYRNSYPWFILIAVAVLVLVIILIPHNS